MRKILVVFLALMFIPLTCVGGYAETDLGNYTFGGYVAMGGGILAGAPIHTHQGYLVQYLPFPQGPLAQTDLLLKSKDGLDYYRFQMLYPGLSGYQDFLLQAGRLGVYHAEIEYDQLQHIYSTVNPFATNIGILVQRLRFSGYYLPTPDIDIFAEDQFIRRTGSQPTTRNSGPGSGAYSFTTPRLRPIGYSQNDAKLGVEYDRPLYQFRLAYNLCNFQNDITALPFARGVFVSEPPSNMANYLTAEGAVNLPAYMTRLTSSFSYGWLTQNDNAFDGTGISGGKSGLTANTLAAYLSGVTRPWAPLTLRYAYRAYDFQNNNGLTNDALFRAFSGTNRPLFNVEQYSYLRQTATVGADYKVNDKLAVDVAYAFQAVDRTQGQGHTRESSPQVGLRLFPTDWLNLIANYTYSSRDGSNFLVLAPNNILTFRTYAGNLERNTANVIAEIYPINNVTISGNFSLYNDNYNNSAFGLLGDQGWSGGVDVSWKPLERVALSLGYDHQQISTKQQVATTTININGVGQSGLVTGDAGPLLHTSDMYDTITAKADFKLIPNRLRLTTSASFSFGSSHFHNPIMPNLNEAFSDISTFLTYRFNDHWACRVGYIFESFFMTRAYQTLYPAGITNTGALPNQSLNTLDGFYRNATAHLVQGFLQYKF